MRGVVAEPLHIRKMNPLCTVSEQVPQLRERPLGWPGLSIRGAFWTEVGHKNRKRPTRAEKERGAKHRLNWENGQGEQESTKVAKILKGLIIRRLWVRVPPAPPCTSST